MSRGMPELTRSRLDTYPRCGEREPNDSLRPGAVVSVLLWVIHLHHKMKLVLLTHPQEDACPDGISQEPQ